jgi:hypothetical protein
MPAEVLCHIVEQLDLESFLGLIGTDRRFRQLFHIYRSSLVLPILLRDFSPLDGLIRVMSATGRMTCLSTTAWHRECCREHIDSIISQWSRLLRVCAVIKRWEAIFPRLRFARRPQSARTLSRQEAHRLRGALYTWWCYAVLFHGDLPRPSQWMPEHFSPDARLNLLRAMSTSETHELRDFWDTLTCAVETDFCPSIDHVRANAVSTDFMVRTGQC